MNDVAIRVHGIGKEYHIGTYKSFDKIGDQLVNAVTAPFRRAGKLLRGQATGASELDEVFWALRDVSFQVNRGEVIGLVGRNGAGKSTLLKILSRITDPSVGYAELYGRVNSLLEVGAGFHQELTGRENIYLKGAILGMKKADIDRKFDEIVEFAGISKFIETPVKHYSSGMYVRLAFSVAAHLEPDILLVDEVLAVGDAEFQRKCLGKMESVASRGRTVLFVSHNMGLIQSLCDRGIYLRHGRLIADGSINDAIAIYLSELKQQSEQDLEERTDREGAGQTKLVNVTLRNDTSVGNQALRLGEPATFEFEVDNALVGLACNFVILDSLGRTLVSFKSNSNGPDDRLMDDENRRFVCELDELFLLPGNYRLDVEINGGGELQDKIEAAAIFDVQPGNIRGRAINRYQGVSMGMPHRWKLPSR